MPTNVNEPVWTTGEAVFSGGGAQASVLIPHDLDTVIIDLADATTADVVDVEVSSNTDEAISGIVERPLRYDNDVAVNDLGGSGELRINAGSALDFTLDGWAVGDTFEILSHRVPGFGPEGTHPTTLGDTEVYTVSSVAAKVIGFTEDPGYSLAEGSIVVAQSRAALLDAGITWFVEGSLDASSDFTTINLSDKGGHRIRVNQSTGTAAVTWEIKGTRQSRRKDAPFVLGIESRPFAGYATDPLVALPSVADGSVVVWDEVVTGGPNASRRQARMTIAGADFPADGVQFYDKVFVGGHSETGNKGSYTVDSRVTTALTFKEPLRGSPGTDTPGRVKLRWQEATRSSVLDSDYNELVFQSGATSFWPVTAQLDPLVDVGPNADSNFVEAGTPASTIVADAPWLGAHAVDNPTGFRHTNTTPTAQMWGATEFGTFELWIQPDQFNDRHIWMFGNGNGPMRFRNAPVNLVEVDLSGPTLADPGAWAPDTVEAQGARVRAIGAPSSNDRVQEAEQSVSGTTAALTAGFGVVDLGGLATLAGATGLANDATVFDAAIEADGAGADVILITGSTAQTFATLITELDLDTTGATWSLIDGNLVCTSDTTGPLSTMDVTEGTGDELFLNLNGFVTIETPEPVGTGEPVFSAVFGTVTDGADIAAFHDGDFGGLLLAATATGLANDATVYHLEVSVDGGGAQLASVTGSAAQTYATLITELDADVTGASWSLKNGELRCTGSSLGFGFTIGITDGGGGGTDMLTTLTDFVMLNTAVISRAEITWRDAGPRDDFHGFGGTQRGGNSDADVLNALPTLVVDTWYHVVVIRRANSNWACYINGAKAYEYDNQPDNTPGTFGTPVPGQVSSVDMSGSTWELGDNGNDEDQFRGRMSKAAVYEQIELSDAEILAHYNKGVELGLTP